jgi:hypothetical protein
MLFRDITEKSPAAGRGLRHAYRGPIGPAVRTLLRLLEEKLGRAVDIEFPFHRPARRAFIGAIISLS